jgi:hypothetical protein
MAVAGKVARAISTVLLVLRWRRFVIAQSPPLKAAFALRGIALLVVYQHAPQQEGDQNR